MKRLLTLIALLAAPMVWAQTPEALLAAREEVRRRQAEVSQLQTEQEKLSAQLSDAAREVAAHKQAGRNSAALQQALRKSQEVSDAMTLVARRRGSAERALREKSEALTSLLSSALATTKEEWTRAKSQPERHQALERMKRLRAELDELRPLPSKAAPLPAALAEDDPLQLLAQADAFRDSEEKLRRQLEVLKGRAAEIRDEQEMDRQMEGWARREALFDESDRRTRFARGNSSINMESSGDVEQAPQAPTDGQFGPSSLPNRQPEVIVGAGAPLSPPQTSGVAGRDRARDSGRDLAAIEAQIRELEQKAAQAKRLAEEAEARATAQP
jgi:hypothetical protein